MYKVCWQSFLWCSPVLWCSLIYIYNHKVEMSQRLEAINKKNIKTSHKLDSMSHLKSLILTSINMLLILRLLWAHKCRIFRPRRKRHPSVIQNLKQINSGGDLVCHFAAQINAGCKIVNGALEVIRNGHQCNNSVLLKCLSEQRVLYQINPLLASLWLCSVHKR